MMEKNVVNNNLSLQLRRKFAIRIRVFLCNLLAFLLSMALIGFAILMTLQGRCFNINTFYHVLNSCNYYENVQSELYKNAEAITLSTGFSSEVLEDVFQADEIHLAVNEYIDATFNGERLQTDSSDLENRLEGKVYKYLEQEGIEPNQEQRANIGVYVSSIAGVYIKSVKVPLLDYFVSLKENYRGIYFMGMVICGSIIVVILIMLFKMNQWLHRFLQYIAYSTSAMAIMLALGPAVLLFTKGYTRIQISPQYYYVFAMNYITYIINTLLTISFCFAILSLILILAEIGIKSNLLKVYKMRKEARS